MNVPPPVDGGRGGNGIWSMISRVRGRITARKGASSPTQIVTIRPRLSNVTDAHSWTSRVDVTLIERPSGPRRR